MIKRLYIALALAFCSFAVASAYTPQDETITYKVMYKWGLINKQAGTVSVQMKVNPDTYSSRLTAASASWADRFYKVRDTLISEVKRANFKPIVYKKYAHEGNDHNRDQVLYSYAHDGTVTGDCRHVNYRDGELRKDETTQYTSIGTTLDMLSAYCYMRTLPYQDWKKNHVVTYTIFSGYKKEQLTIKYYGREVVEYDGKKYDCFKITFMFTSDGKTKSSDDMFAWITDDDKRIPVKLEGKLPIGSIKCFYTGE